MVRIRDTDLPGDPLKLLSSRVSRREMTLHMVEQARHLAKYVIVRCESEDVSLGSVEVAPCPLDTWSIAEEAEALARFRSLPQGRLPGRFKVNRNRIPQDLIVRY